jgi:hypothetical protein
MEEEEKEEAYMWVLRGEVGRGDSELFEYQLIKVFTVHRAMKSGISAWCRFPVRGVMISSLGAPSLSGRYSCLDDSTANRADAAGAAVTTSSSEPEEAGLK